MLEHQVATREAWLEARKQLLAEEKEMTHLRDALAAKRRALPWVKIDKPYRFDGPEGEASLSDLFGPRRQLIVYHFMFAPEWEQPCKSCSFWSDGVNGVLPHLEQRDTRFVAISRAPYEKLAARAKIAGYAFPWYSSGRSDFNYDFGVSFRPEDLAAGTTTYNYGPNTATISDLPGASMFIKGDDGAIYHAYSSFARGLEMTNPAYQYLDLTPLGRHEDGLTFPMEWVRLREDYAA
ncbi:MAG: DUF899 domain-containing protein [Hyphomicrobiales bacterium]|nr:DUF899 domain-containing protein [Hyphomicrobiales bacterium]MBV8663608.1 DUF899 domain-containing protein [Hyphomicrobiales bacterium]